MQLLVSIILYSVLGYFIYEVHGWEIAVAITLALWGLAAIADSVDNLRQRLSSIRKQLDKHKETEERYFDVLHRRLDSLSEQVSRIKDAQPSRSYYDVDD